MAYFIEYTVPAAQEDAEYTIPASDQESGYTIPLGETGTERIHTDELPVRSSVLGASVAEAKAAAEEVLSHSRATRAQLFEDAENSTTAGSGTLLASYAEGSGWQDRV